MGDEGDEALGFEVDGQGAGGDIEGGFGHAVGVGAAALVVADGVHLGGHIDDLFAAAAAKRGQGRNQRLLKLAMST